MSSQYQDFELDGVPFKILSNQPPRDSVGSNSKVRIIQYEITFKDFGQAQKALIGWPEYYTTADGYAAISRHVPHSYTDPNGAYLYCTAITDAVGVQPKALVSDTDDPYELMHLTCRYEVLPYPILSDEDVGQDGRLDTLNAYSDMGNGKIIRYIEVGEVQSTGTILKQQLGGYCFCHLQRAGEALTPGNYVIDNGVTYILDTRQVVSQGVPVRYFEQIQELIWHHVPRDNAGLSRLFTYQFKINVVPFWIWPVGTAMLDTIKPEFTQEVDGTYSWRIRFRFRINPAGWNFLPDPQRGNIFRRVANIASPFTGLFQFADLNEIFAPGNGP